MNQIEDQKFRLNFWIRILFVIFQPYLIGTFMSSWPSISFGDCFQLVILIIKKFLLLNFSINFSLVCLHDLIGKTI